MLDGEQGKVTVADLVEKAEEEKESEEVKEKNGEAADGEAEEEEVAPPVEPEEAPLTQVTILLSRINSYEIIVQQGFK